MTIVILLNILVLGASFLLAKKYNGENPIRLILSLVLFFYSQIILIQLFWGILGRLYSLNIVISSLLVFLACYSLFGRGEKSLNLFQLYPGLTANKVIIFCLSVILGFGLVKAAINLVNPPFGWDCLNYHFTFPVEWLKHGNLNNPITINDDLGPSYYPINGGLIYLWFMLPLKNVFLADLGQIPFFIISFIALYGICRKLNIGKEYSFYAAGLFSITPNYFKQMEISYVDVMVCGWFLVSLYFLLSFYYQLSIKNALLFALGLGMLIGVKTIALPYSALPFGFFIIALFRNYKSLGLRGIIVYLIFAVFLIGIVGGYGYLRNFFQTGNPFYPLSVKFLGKEIFHGVFDKANWTAHSRPYDYSLGKMLFHEGMGAGLIVFFIPGVFFFILQALKRRLSLERIFVFSLPILLYLIWRYVIPLPNLRYLYPALALGFIAPFSFLPVKRPYIIIVRCLVVLCFLASCFEISNRLELAASLLLSAALFFSLNKIYVFLRNLKVYQWLIILFITVVSLYALNVDYNKNESRRYTKMIKYSGFWPDATRAWNWLNENTRGNNIAYVGRPVPFPLYGTNFKNNVFYVSVNSTDPAMAHYFPHSHYSWGADFMELHKNLEAEGNYREHPEYSIWINNLRRRKSDYLFVYSLHQTKEIIFPIEDLWAATNPDKFLLQFSNPTIHIYKIR